MYLTLIHLKTFPPKISFLTYFSMILKSTQERMIGFAFLVLFILFVSGENAFLTAIRIHVFNLRYRVPG